MGILIKGIFVCLDSNATSKENPRMILSRDI